MRSVLPISYMNSPPLVPTKKFGMYFYYFIFFNCSSQGKLQKRKWENAMTLDRKSWGFRRDASFDDFLSMEELLETLLKTIR